MKNMIKYQAGAQKVLIRIIFRRGQYMTLSSRPDIHSAQKRTAFYLSLSFLIPFLILLSTFIVQGVHPFGSHMILTVDLYHQYAPFVAELRDKIFNGESLWYSWNIGLGTNFWAIFANYASSPLNLLMLFFPQKFLSDGIALVVCLRAGLSGLFFAMLLRDMDNRREDLFMSCFAGFYALCGWTLAYFWNIMWFDAVMLLPLIVLGLRYLMRDKKPLLYCISLFLCVWSNYYAAYFVCFFLILYAPVCYLTVFRRSSLRNAWSSVWRFSVYSVLAGGLSAVLVYPTWVALKQSSATGDAFPKDYTLTQNLFDFLGRFFVTSDPNIREGMANVYCGVLILMFVPLYFMCSKIRLREKICNGLVLLFLYFSFSSKILNFIWHGFHFPNQIPYRQAFLMSFILVIMAYKVLRNLMTFTVNEITVSAAVVLGYLVLYEKFGGEDKEWMLAIFLTAGFVIAYALVFRVIILQNRSLRMQKNLLAGVIIVELLVAAQVTVGLVSMNESFTGWDFYGKKSNEVTSFIEEQEQTGDDGIFVRAEIYPAFISNETALYHLKGMSVFSSTADESFIVFMKSLGFHNNGINGVRNFGLTEVTASLLGINYLIDVNGDSAVPAGMTEVTDTGDLAVLKNTDALSVGYMVSPEVLSFITQNSSNPFITTNNFLKSLGVDPVYSPEVLLQSDMINASYTSGSPESGYSFAISADDIQTDINVKPSAAVSGSHIYLYVNSTEGLSVTVSGTNPDTSETSSTTQETRTGQIIDLGTYDPAMDQNVRLSWSSPSSGQVSVICYSIDEPAYQEMLRVLGTSELTVTSYNSTHLTGTVNAAQDGVLLLTIPVDNGWSAKIDGESAVISNIGDALMGISLTKGTHEISLTYAPEGIGMGAKISLASLLVIILLMGVPYSLEIRRRINKGKEILAAAQNSSDVVGMEASQNQKDGQNQEDDQNQDVDESAASSQYEEEEI